MSAPEPGTQCVSGVESVSGANAINPQDGEDGEINEQEDDMLLFQGSMQVDALFYTPPSTACGPDCVRSW